MWAKSLSKSAWLLIGRQMAINHVCAMGKRGIVSQQSPDEIYWNTRKHHKIVNGEWGEFTIFICELTFLLLLLCLLCFFPCLIKIYVVNFPHFPSYNPQIKKFLDIFQTGRKFYPLKLNYLKDVGTNFTKIFPRRLSNNSEAGHSGLFTVARRSWTKFSNNGR